MTVRLYYENSYLKEFSAVVAGQEQRADNPAVILDRTAFYPASGGQPHDLGNLGSAKVLDVQEETGGNIVHVLDRPLRTGPVLGSLDWDRRFDHMQQHTGQHILSQAFWRVAHASTVSFHMGEHTATIDLSLQEPSSALLREVENLANAIVFEDRPIHVLNVDHTELAALGIRKETDREGTIRVIDIEGFDRSACGGTHVRRSGEVGMIFLLGIENYKGGIRVEFVCGKRALVTLRTDHELLRQIGQLYSAHPRDLPRLTEKMMQERTEMMRANLRLQDRVLDAEAEELYRAATTRRDLRVINRTYSERRLEDLKTMSQKIIEKPAVIVVLAAISAETAQVVVAKSPDLAGDCAASVKQTSAKLGGKGGGRTSQAQAGGIAVAQLQEWILEVTEALCRASEAEPG